MEMSGVCPLNNNAGLGLGFGLRVRVRVRVKCTFLPEILGA